MNWNDKTAANVKAIKPSGIRKFFDIAAQVKGVLSLSIGEPDFAAPDKVLAAMKASLDAKETSYTGNSGMMELREAISHHFEQRYGVHYDPKDEILVTVGVSEGLAMALLAITEPGDEVIIPDPAYVAYPASVELAGGTPVFVPTYPEHDFKLTVEALEKVITPKTKAIVIGYPNNPTGTVMSAEELMPIAKFAEEHDLIVLSDEIYCELMYGDAKFTSFAKLPGMRERTVIFNGFSKAYAMTGWRIGYALANPTLTAAMTKIHQYTMLCAPITAQIAAVEALRHGEKYMKKMVAEYDRRRRLIYDGLTKMGLECFEPKGAFYIFPNISSTGYTSNEFAEELLKAEHVALVPGSAFGACGEGHVRCSYATSIDKISEALNRIENFLKNHKK